ncbi:hypothetical protein [Nonomuraea insulae]|uniref:Uncharacterized protein n=1 Tax=Nonomuraea insulae TaxID=1616787 RepID=A0ABW1CC34_9ACTN
MPENDKSDSKRTKILVWAGGVLTAVLIAGLTDSLSPLIRLAADLLNIGRPALRATVVPAGGRAPHLAVSALPATPQDRALFLGGRFTDPAFLDLAGQLGGAWVKWVRVRVVFTAGRGLVRITNVRVKEDPDPGPNVVRAFVEYPSETMSRNPQLIMNLDSPAPFFASVQKPGSAYFGPESLPVEQGKQKELGFEIRAGSHSHTFKLEVEYVPAEGGKPESLTVSDAGGRPFRVTGAPDRYTGYGTVYRNTGAGLHAVTGRAACELFEPERACVSPG